MYEDELDKIDSAPQEEDESRRINAEDIQGGLDGATTIANAFSDGNNKASGIASMGKSLGGNDLMSTGGTGTANALAGATEGVGGAAGGAGAGGGKGAAIAAGAGAASGLIDKGVDKALGDNSPDVKEGEQVAPKTTDENGNEVDDPNGPKKGDKVAPGMEVDENGNAKRSATSRVQDVAAQGAAAYFAHGDAKAMAAAKKASSSKTGRRLSDVVDKAPGAHQVSELADKSGLLDTAEGALGAYTNAKNGDYKQAAKDAKKALKGTKKTKKFVFKVILIVMLIMAAPTVVLMGTIAVVADSLSNESTSSSEEVYENMGDYDWPSEDNIGGENDGGSSGDNGNGSISDATVLFDIPYYNQGNYKNKKFGGGTISSSGCSVTSLAMVIEYLTGNKTTPPNVVDKIAEKTGNYNHFYAGSQGQSWEIMTTVPTYYGLKGEQISLSSVKSALDAGHPVIASMKCCTFTSAGHFIVIKGYNAENNTFYVNDPNHSNFSTQAFAYSIFVNEGHGFWAFSK